MTTVQAPNRGGIRAPLRSYRSEVVRRPGVKPPASPKLALATFNLQRGFSNLKSQTTNVAAVVAELKKLGADTIALQELPVQGGPAATRKYLDQLAAGLNMHAVWVPGHGNAILTSRKVLSSGVARFGTQNAASKHEDRLMLNAVIDVAGKPVRVVDTHLDLQNPRVNAAQLAQARLYVQNHSRNERVVLAGDFNLDFASVGQPIAKREREFAERYQFDATAAQRANGVGNIKYAQTRGVAEQLDALTQDAWEAPRRTQVQLDGRSMTPEQATALLSTTTDPRRRRELARAIDGVTHASANKRFDNVFVANRLRVTDALVDLSAKASDHDPVRVLIDVLG